MPNLVICRSDHDYLGYPLAFYWQDQRLEVNEVLLHNRTPKGHLFTVRCKEFGTFQLDYDISADEWSVQQLI